MYKNRRVYIIFLFVICIIFTSCTHTSENKQEKYHSELYFCFDGSENQYRFNELISDNSIDRDYLDFCAESNISTNNDMVKWELEFAEIWKTEFEYSYKRYADLLDDELREEYISAQEQWIDSVSTSMSVYVKTVDNVWSGYRWETAHDYMIELRTHTLYIKYCEYLYEISHSSDPSYSVSFYYDGAVGELQ